MATIDILSVGYVGDRVAGTVSLVRDGAITAIVDPGMVADRSAILGPLAKLGVNADEVTDVIISHHHPDHTWNIALFPTIRLHDYWATYEGDVWTSRPAEGVELTPSIRLLETPGHTREDLTTLVETENGTFALSHLWWTAESQSDPRGWDLGLLHHHRTRVLDQANVIVPGHGNAFAAEVAPR